MVSTPPRTQLDALLVLVTVKLELSPTQRKDAEDKYQAVSDWLSAPGSLLAQADPDLYPQGSLRLQTTVKPRSHEEYDLDIVCQFLFDAGRISPGQLYNLLATRLRENATYREMLEPKNRCLRLRYAGQFHMDILPAVPDKSLGGTAIFVPDRKAQAWSPSNPRGFAGWFEGQMQQTGMVAKAMEPLPVAIPVPAKSPLQRATQLIKRQRDQSVAQADLATPSIVLTTLAGDAFDGQASTAEAVSRYLARTIELLDQARSVPFRVFNPSNPKELLSERWETEPAMYGEFERHTRLFADRWGKLLRASGLPEIGALMKELFGETVTDAAINDYHAGLAKARQTGTLGIRAGSTGLSLGASSLTRRIPPNTNYGNPES